MADKQPFAGLSQEDTNQAVVQLLAAILDRLPRVDGNDRLIVNASEVAVGSTPITGSLSAVTTVSDVTRINAFGSTQARIADMIPIHIANAGAAHIYDNIKVT